MTDKKVPKVKLSDSPVSQENAEILINVYRWVDSPYVNSPLTTQAIIEANERYYVVRNGKDEVVGGVALIKSTGEIQKLVVLPQYRGKGYGVAIVRKVEKTAHSLSHTTETHMYIKEDNSHMLKRVKEYGYHRERKQNGSIKFYRNLTTKDGKRPPRPPFEVTIGADPEFLFVKESGIVVPANKYFRHQGHFGTDAYSTLAEIRPQPSSNPKEVVSNMKAIMKEGLMKSLDLWHLNWRAGSYYNNCYLGGHIHLGFDYSRLTKERAVSALDYFLAPFVLLMEDSREARRRRRNFGRLGDYHDHSYGIEYRVPSSFIVSPTITEQVFALAKTITIEANNRKLSIPLVGSVERDKFLECDKAYFRGVTKERWSTIKDMKLFKDYKHILNPFKKFIDENEDWNGMAKDIKTTWELLTKEDLDKVVIPRRRVAEKIWQQLGD